MSSPKTHRLGAALALAVIASLILPALGEATGHEVHGTILLPSAETSRPQRCFHTIAGDPMQGVAGWVLETTPGMRFELIADDDSGFTDFDLYFYTELPACQDSAGATAFAGPGDEAGTVPDGHRYAIVVLFTGLPPQGFTYKEGAVAALSPDEPPRPGAFEPKVVSQPLYGSQHPSTDPERQEKFIEAVDGTSVYVETWLPAAKDENVPPEKVPTILIATPYVTKGSEEYPGLAEYMNARGFAVAQHHVRGTGESGGCIEQTSDKQIDDGARVIEYLGRDAPWSNGNVGMYGISYDAETQISVAGRGDPSKISYLKAIIPASAVGGQYEYNNRDGVPFDTHGFESNLFYLAISAVPQMTPLHYSYLEKAMCQPEMLTEPLDMSGDMRPFWKVREYRPDAHNIRAATLWVHGFADFNVEPITIAGYFDRLPATTPKKGLFGIWNHAFPSSHSSVAPEWARADWMPMVVAWFDRYLKNIQNGAEDWPAAQVQSSDGTWRSEPDFPSTGGPAGQLALGPHGRLGVTQPSGSTSYTEVRHEFVEDESNRAVFESEPVTAALRITGQPLVDLWIKSSKPDAHVVAELQVIDPDGEPLRYSTTEGLFSPLFGGGALVATYGLRSIRHLDPMPENYFKQEVSRPAPVDTPIQVVVRLLPTDITVPEGHRLRLTIAGTTSIGKQSSPSGVESTIGILHDCDHPSSLRFLMPTPGAPLINVREVGEEGPLAEETRTIGVADGGGIANAAVCGRAPEATALPIPPTPAAPAPPVAPSSPAETPAIDVVAAPTQPEDVQPPPTQPQQSISSASAEDEDEKSNVPLALIAALMAAAIAISIFITRRRRQS